MSNQLGGLAVLAEPARQALYDYVVAQPDAVGREEAAAAAGVTRAVAAFHLDRLVRAGLLVTESRRLTGRQGPGAGRPAKLYRRAPGEFAVTVPPRRYDLAAELLADAVQRTVAAGGFVGARLKEAARARGTALGEAALARLRGRTSRRSVVSAVEETLREHGYEPRVDGDDIVLANCPFDSLADRHRDLVCGMNRDLLTGLAETLPSGQVTARLAPSDGMCCVRLRVATGTRTGRGR
jgi:predicted ArsR family transcriptional regulator